MGRRRTGIAAALTVAVCLLAASAEAAQPVTYAQCVANGAYAATCASYAAAATACHGETFPTTGTIKYACDCQAGADANCVAGSDANSGNSPATAYQSWTKVIAAYSALPAGGTLALCRGGAFTASGVTTTVANNSCTVVSPCLLRDYVPTNWTPAVDAQPIAHTGANNSIITWNESATLHQNGFRVLNLDVEGDSASNSTGFSFNNQVSDVELCGNTINGLSTAAVTFLGTGTFPGGCYSAGPPIVNTCPWQRHIAVQGNTITNIVSGGSFELGDFNGFDSNYFQTVGCDNSPDHVLYFGALEMGALNPQTQVIARGEYFTNNAIVDPGGGGTCDGVIVVSHGAHTGMNLSGNSISFLNNPRTGNCFGIGPGAGTVDYVDQFINTTISNNVIAGFSTQAITVTSSQNYLISNNVMTDNSSSISDTCIVAGQGIQEEYDLSSTNGSIVNNTCYLTGAVTNNAGIKLTAQGNGVTVANNVTNFDTATAGHTYYCFDYNMGTALLQGGTISTTIGLYTGTTNGGLDLTINGTNHQITGLNFSTATNIYDVVATFRTAINTALSGTNATWTGTYILINTPARSTPTTIAAAVAPTGGGSPTDVSTLLGMSSGGGAVVSSLLAFGNNNLCYAPAGPTLLWDQGSGDTFSAWKSGFGFDGASIVAAPLFASPSVSVQAYPNWLVPQSGSTLVAAGNHANAPTLDLAGLTRPNPPAIGAYEPALSSTRNAPRNTLFFFGGLCLLVAIGFGVVKAQQDRRRHAQIHTRGAEDAERFDELEQHLALDSGLATEIADLDLAALRKQRCPDCGEPLYVSMRLRPVPKS